MTKTRTTTAHDEAWPRARLGDIAEFVMGQAPPGSASNFEGRGTVFVKAGEFGRERPEVREWTTKPLKHAKLDDVLICVVGATAGKLNLGLDCAIGRSVAAIRLRERLRPRFLYYQLMPMVPALRAASAGSAQGVISKSDLARIELRVPSISVQDLVIAEIEKQFTRLDAGVEALKRLQAHLRRYRAAVLAAAVTGSLWASKQTGGDSQASESGTSLLARILGERRARWERVHPAKTYCEPDGPDTDGLPELPGGWCWSTAEQLSDETRSITYGVIKLGEPVPGGVPTLRSSDVRHLRLDLDGVKSIAPSIANNYRRTFLEGGELLVTVRGTLGGIVVAPPSCRGFNVSREIAVVSLVDPRLARCAAVFIASPQLQAWLMRRAKGIAYTGVNIETLKRLPIPIPPLAEQDGIVKEVERRFSMIDASDRIVRDSLGRARSLRASVLQAAFAGRLTSPSEA